MKLSELVHELERIRIIHGDDADNWDITLAVKLGKEKYWVNKADMTFEEFSERHALIITGSQP